jgi:hypothetical protein
MFPDASGKSCGLKMFMPQGKMPVARQPLAASAPVAACLHIRSEQFANLVDGDESP